MKNNAERTPARINPQSLKRLQLVTVLSSTGRVTLSNTTVGNWLASGCPRNPDSTLNLVEVCAWLAAEHRKPEAKPANSAIEDLRRNQSALAEFKLQRQRGEYFSHAEVVAQFEEAASRMKAVLEAVERNHGTSVGRTIRAALKKSFTGIEEMLANGPAHKSA